MLAQGCGLIAIAGALLGAGVPAQTGTPRPNIVLIHADDLGWGDLGSYGQQRFATPTLDRLAAQGTRFTQYYAGSTVCAPSRAALMTGLHTGHAWIRGNGEIPLRPEDVTLGEVLASAGYRTGVIGKWGLGTSGTTGRPDEQGFPYSFGVLHHRHAHRQYTDHLWRNGARVPVAPTEYVSDLLAADAVRFVKTPSAQPFFLYLAFPVPHAELRVPDPALTPLRGRFEEPRPFTNARLDAVKPGQEQEDADYPGGYRSQPTPRAAFAAMVTRMDQHVAEVLEALRVAGVEQQTLVLFTSDNGPHHEGGADPAFFNSSGGLRGMKRDLYEGGIRVPMIARWPGVVPAGRVSDHPWAHWDLLPTLAEFAGARVPDGLDGLSMGPALRGQAQQGHEFLYWEFHERGFEQAVRMGRWKAVRHGPGTRPELYDLVEDPSERTNRGDTEPQVLATIERIMTTARTESQRWPVRPYAP